MDKTYEPRNFEDKIYKNWLEKDYFSANVNPDKKPFTVMMPPPNITGQLHIGHALDLTIQDAIIRYKRMKGFEALYMPGTDHASIATEMKIVEKMREKGETKQSVGRTEFLKRAFEWNDLYGGRIVEQQRRLGLSCDWDKSAFTMDERRSEAVKEVFVNMYESGLIYRGEKIINWCPSCRTALSDAEVEFEADDSHLWHIKYPFEDGSGFITVATTRPETMLGDTAVAVNPRDARYKAYVGKNLVLPLCSRIIPVIADSYVESDFGSGAVKITPAHDPNDFEIGLRHKLPLIKVMDDGGVMNGQAGVYCGLSRAEARKKVVTDLKAQGFLIKTEDYRHNVGHCYRCRDTVEPAVSKQWFVCMDKLAAPAVEAVKSGKIKFIPKHFEKLYLHWMANTRDWCISRQLWWGHRIPVYYCQKCGAQHASKTDLTVCPACGGAVKQDEDVLDTWFSSALWPFSTLNWPEKSPELSYFYPTNVLVTAYDIIGFWVSRMIVSGLRDMGEVPFTEVLIHGIVRDSEGKKMSKSSGNGVDPLEAINKMGADALRYSLVAGTAMGGDTKFSEEKLESYRNFMNKLWNAARFVLMSTEGAKILPMGEDIKWKLSIADKWILGRLNFVISAVTRLMDRYEVGLAANMIYEFVWNEFCDWYIEKAKVLLSSGDGQKRDITASVLLYVLREILKLIHPLSPFITAEIYSGLPNRDAEDIMIAPYPAARTGVFKSAIKDMTSVIGLIKGIRNLRREMNVSNNKKTAILLLPLKGRELLIRKASGYIQKLAMGSGCEIIAQKPEGRYASLVTDIAEVYIPMGELVDFSAEIERLSRELNAAEVEINRAESKLNNAGFTARAPAALVEAEREKVRKYTEQKKLIQENLNKLR